MTAAVQRLRNSLTPGQRWTSVFALVLMLALLAFGAPDHVINEEGPAAPVRQLTPAPIDAALPALPSLSAVGDLGPTDVPPAGELAPEVAAPAPPPPPSEGTGTDGDEPDEAALRCTADTGLPMPFFSMVVAAVRQLEGTVVDASGQSLPVNPSVTVGTQAGCSG